MAAGDACEGMNRSDSTLDERSRSASIASGSSSSRSNSSEGLEDAYRQFSRESDAVGDLMQLAQPGAPAQGRQRPVLQRRLSAPSLSGEGRSLSPAGRRPPTGGRAQRVSLAAGGDASTLAVPQQSLSRVSSQNFLRSPSGEEDNDQPGEAEVDWTARSAGEWSSRIMSMETSEERREACIGVIGRIESMLPQAYALSSMDRVKLTDLLEAELEAKQQVVTNSAYSLVKKDFAELKQLREDNAEYESRMMDMNKTYLREITNKRDMTRTASVDMWNSLTQEGLVGGDVQFYEPLQHLSSDTRQCVLSILEEKIKAIFDWDPTAKEKTSKVELAKFEDSLLRERLASYQRLNAQLREEVRELRVRVKQAETGNQKHAWEHAQLEGQNSRLKSDLDRMREDLASMTEACEEANKEVKAMRKRLAKEAEKQDEVLEIMRNASAAKDERVKEQAELAAEASRRAAEEAERLAAAAAKAHSTVTRGVQTEVIAAASREPSKQSPSSGARPKNKTRRESVVVDLPDERDMGDPLEKRLFDAQRQAEIAVKALHQRDETIQNLNTRIDMLKISLENAKARGFNADGGDNKAAEGDAGESPGSAGDCSAQAGSKPGSKARCSPVPGNIAAAARAAGSQSSSSSAPYHGPLDSGYESDGPGKRGSSRTTSPTGRVSPGRTSPGSKRQSRRPSGSPVLELMPEKEKSKSKASSSELMLAAVKEENVKAANARIEFAESVSERLREELEATRDQLAAAERRLQIMMNSRDTSALTKELEAETRARREANEELELSRAALGSALSKIRVLEAALNAKNAAPPTPVPEEEDEPLPVEPTELENALNRASAAQAFKAVTTLQDQKKHLRNQVTAQKAQLGTMLQENQVLHLAMEEMQREIQSLTKRLREHLPDAQVVGVDAEALLKRMEKVAAQGVGGYLRLYKQARLKEVGNSAVATKKADADHDAEVMSGDSQDCDRSLSPHRANFSGPFQVPADEQQPNVRTSDSNVFSVVSFAQWGAHEVPLTSPHSSTKGMMPGGSVAKARARMRSPDKLDPRLNYNPPRSARQLGEAMSTLGLSCQSGLGLPAVQLERSARKSAAAHVNMGPSSLAAEKVVQRGPIAPTSPATARGRFQSRPQSAPRTVERATSGSGAVDADCASSVVNSPSQIGVGRCSTGHTSLGNPCADQVRGHTARGPKRPGQHAGGAVTKLPAVAHAQAL